MVTCSEFMLAYLEQSFAFSHSKKLLTILRVRLTSEKAISNSLLAFRLTQCQSHRNRSWTAIKLHLDDVRNILSCQCPLLSAIRFDKQRQRFRNTNRIG